MESQPVQCLADFNSALACLMVGVMVLMVCLIMCLVPIFGLWMMVVTMKLVVTWVCKLQLSAISRRRVLSCFTQLVRHQCFTAPVLFALGPLLFFLTLLHQSTQTPPEMAQKLMGQPKVSAGSLQAMLDSYAAFALAGSLAASIALVFAHASARARFPVMQQPRASPVLAGFLFLCCGSTLNIKAFIAGEGPWKQGFCWVSYFVICMFWTGYVLEWQAGLVGWVTSLCSDEPQD